MLNIQQFEVPGTCNDLYPVQVLHQKFISTAQDFVCCFSKNCHFNGTIFGNNSVETYGFFCFWMSLPILCKGHCVTMSEVIIHFLCYIPSNKTLFDMVKHVLLLFDFF